MSDYVKATWVGYPAESPVFGDLIPGVTVCEIPAAEAKTSDHWQPVQAPAPKPGKGTPPTAETEE